MNIEAKIKKIDWVKYSGPEYYNPENLIEALLHLITYDKSKAKNGLDNKVLYSLGNNHAGTYYPAILEAADLIIEMEKKSESKSVRNCAYAILNDLYYCEPELGTYQEHSYEQILNFVRVKLDDYKDKT